MHTLTAFVVDADAERRDDTRQLLHSFPFVQVVGEDEGGSGTAESIRELDPELVLLRMEPHSEAYLRLIRAMRTDERPLFVIRSSAGEDATRAYEARAFDVLVDPVSRERLAGTLERASQWVYYRQLATKYQQLTTLVNDAGSGADGEDGSSSDGQTGEPLERLIVRRGRRFLFLKADQIDWIEANDIYVRIHASERSYLVRERMKTFEHRLDRRRFMRIHRSAIVNLNHVKEIVPRPKGGAVVTLNSGAKLPMSRGYLDRLDTMLSSPPPRTQVL